MSKKRLPISETDYYKKSVDEISKKFNVYLEKGLSPEEVDKRIKKYGLNKIKIEEPPSWLHFFINNLTGYVSLLLLFVAIIAFLSFFIFSPELERIAEGFIIISIVLINAISGAYQEYKSEKTAQKLEEMIVTRATVIRNGEYEDIDSQELVPGDIIEVETGDKIPADVRLIETENLEVLEANLTGESSPSLKKSRKLSKDTSLAERENMAYLNTYVTRGRGKGIVVATGQDTEIGLIAEVSKENKSSRAPFLEEVQVASRQISYLAIFLVILVALGFSYHGKDIYQIFMLSSALLIGAIPAALPVTVTYSLTHAMKSLSKKDILVKNLPFLESAGGVDVICTDKTGTLTENKMKVRKILLSEENKIVDPKEFDAEENKELVRCALLANEAEPSDKNKEYIGDPEDIGLLEFLKSKNIDVRNREREYYIEGFLPFSSENKMTQVLTKINKKNIRYTKGAPEVILKRCNQILIKGKLKKLNPKLKKEILKKVKKFSKSSLRNLAFSYKTVKKEELGEETKGDIFLGIMGLEDPPRKGVKEAIKTCYDAGIEIKMLTGDDKDTAVAIAKQCGFKNIKSATWEELKGLSKKKIDEIVETRNVFSRMDPKYKTEIVNSLHRLGKRVAITGDGVNDTSAMKAAEVGISMGKQGSDIAREASDIILLDNSFNSIKDAIKQGRTSLSNVRKVTNYLMTANLFEVLVLFISAFLGFTPLRAIQLLWINFATDIFPAIGLASDPSHPDIMKKKPTGKKERIITRRVWELVIGIGIKKIILAFVTFFVVLYLSEGSTTILGVTGNLILAQTAVFVWLGLSHIIRIVEIRWDEGWEGMNLFINKIVNYSIAWPIIAKLIILYLPVGGFALAHFFYAEPLPVWVWCVITVTLVSAIFLAMAIAKGIDNTLGEYSEEEY